MKGKVKVRVEVCDECGRFPITETWEYTRDNTYESLQDWLELFSKILATQGLPNEDIEKLIWGEE